MAMSGTPHRGRLSSNVRRGSGERRHLPSSPGRVAGGHRDSARSGDCPSASFDPTDRGHTARCRGGVGAIEGCPRRAPASRAGERPLARFAPCSTRIWRRLTRARSSWRRERPFAPPASDVRDVLERVRAGDEELADAVTVLAGTGMRKAELPRRSTSGSPTADHDSVISSSAGTNPT